MRRKNGYLTIYLSLSLSLILSFILTMIEGARRHTVHMEAECITDIGMNSVLAEFHRELLEQYDLLFVDMSYGTSHAAIENSCEHLRNYMQRNCKGTEAIGNQSWFAIRDWLSLYVEKAMIYEYSIASDYGGNRMKRQALEYMKEASAEGILVNLIEQVNQVKSLELDTKNITAERDSIQSQIDAVELPMQMDEEGELHEITLDNPADAINAFRDSFTLKTVLGSDVQISGVVIQPENYISHRERRSGIGTHSDFHEPTGIEEDLLFDCYLFEKCGHYGNEMEKSLLKYQIEYVIGGKDSDVGNLENVVKRLLLWREVSNVAYILSDSGKCTEAELLALTLTAVSFVPELAEPVKYAILFAWAYIESIQDVKCLLNGGRVPLIKTEADWKTGIKDLVGFSGHVSDEITGGRGLNYEDYLRIMLCLEDNTKKNMRAMDLMEMDIRQTPSNAYFCMDACFDSYAADIVISSSFGYSYEVKRKYSYD